MRIFLGTLTALMLLFAAGCMSSSRVPPPDPGLKEYGTIHLAPVTFSTHQGLSHQRTVIATVLEKELAQQLSQKGYAVVTDRATAEARLHVDITYIGDERLYGDASQPFGQLYPDLRLSANVTLTDLENGRVLLQSEVRARGRIDPPYSPAPEAKYTKPQRNLARRISQLFPVR